MKSIPIGLAVGGLDPSGGAGVMVDVRTIAAFGFHPMAVVTALTTQSLHGLKGYRTVDAGLLGEQLDCLFEKSLPSFIKIGMLGDAEVIGAVSERLQRMPDEIPVVLDPVLGAGAGGDLISKAGYKKMKEKLFPLVSIITPNATEAEGLAQWPVHSGDDARTAAEKIITLGARAVLIKGGHMPGEPTDYLYDGVAHHCIPGARLPGANVRGTGCVHASAMAACLARGMNLVDAAREARAFVVAYIKNARGVGESGIRVGLLSALD